MHETPDVDRLVAVLAALPCGAFRRSQVLAIGGNDDLIRRRLRQRRWDRVAPGVYVLPSDPTGWHQRLWIARLAADPFAVVTGGRSWS